MEDGFPILLGVVEVVVEEVEDVYGGGVGLGGGAVGGDVLGSRVIAHGKAGVPHFHVDVATPKEECGIAGMLHQSLFCGCERFLDAVIGKHGFDLFYVFLHFHLFCSAKLPPFAHSCK